MKEKPQRLAPTVETLRALFARSGNQCAFPDCVHPLIDEENNFIAQICHIEDALPGCRFNENMSNEKRRSFDNLILLCYRHHVQTNNKEKFPSYRLKEIKSKHEAQFKEDFKQSDSTLRNIYGIVKVLFRELREIKNDTSETLKRVTKSDKKLDRVLSILSEERGDKNDKKGKYLMEIESIIKLRDTNSQKAAIKLYNELREKNWEKLNGLEKYKLTGNIGICLLDLDRDTEAAEHFIEAINYDPENERGWGLAALGHAILGQKQDSHEYIDKLLAKNPDNLTAYVALISIYRNQIEFSEIISKIPERLLDTLEISYALGTTANGMKDYDNAIYWLQNAIEHSDNKDAEVKANLATVILQSIADPYKIFTGQLDIESRNKIHYSIELLTDAWEKFKDSDLGKTKSWILINRSQAKRYIKDYNGANEDLIEAKTLQEDKYIPIKGLAVLYFETKRLDEALILIKELKSIKTKNEDKEFNIDLFKAVILFKKGEYKQSIDLLKNIIITTNNQTIKEITINTLINSYLALNYIEEAKEISSKYLTEHPDSWRGYLNASLVFAAGNEQDKSLLLLNDAFKKITQDTHPIDIQDIAFQFLNHREFNKAIELLERITNSNVYSHLSENLLNAYYSAGEYQKALDMCQSFQSNYGPIDFVTEIQSAIYESIHDFTRAIEVCKDFLKIYPDDLRIKVRLAILYARKNDFSEVKQILSGIVEFGDLSMNILFQIAYLIILTGDLQRGLDMAYETRRKFKNRGESHLRYFGLIAELQSLTSSLGEFETVSINTAVGIKDDSGEVKVYYVIEGEEKLSENEILASERLGVSLIGKKIGEIVSIDRSIGEPQKYEVVSIQSKFIYAFQESIHLLDKRFVEIEAFRSFTFNQTGNPRNDLKPIFDSLDISAKFDSELFELYLKKRLPLGSCAQIKKINPIRFWANVIGNIRLGIISIGPFRQNLIMPINDLKRGTGIVIDLVSLLTLDSIQKLDLLEAIPNKKLIAHSSIECINDLLREFNGLGSEGYFNLGKVDNHYVKQETTKEQIADHIKHYQELLQWIEKNCEIFPCNDALTMNARKKEQYNDILGTSFIDTILIAKEHSFLLFADEEALRGFAYDEFKVKGFPNYTLINFCLKEDIIDEKQFSNIIAKLIALNYKFLPISSSILMQCLDMSEYQVKFPFDLAIQTFKRVFSPEDLAIKDATEFFYKFFVAIQLPQIRINVSIAVLSNLINGRNPIIVEKKLKNTIQLKFRVLQLQKEVLFGIIDDFMRMK